MTTIQKIFFYAGIIETFLIAIAILVAWLAFRNERDMEKRDNLIRQRYNQNK